MRIIKRDVIIFLHILLLFFFIVCFWLSLIRISVVRIVYSNSFCFAFTTRKFSDHRRRSPSADFTWYYFSFLTMHAAAVFFFFFSPRQQYCSTIVCVGRNITHIRVILFGLRSNTRVRVEMNELYWCARAYRKYSNNNSRIRR